MYFFSSNIKTFYSFRFIFALKSLLINFFAYIHTIDIILRFFGNNSISYYLQTYFFIDFCLRTNIIYKLNQKALK